jgi:hypothetical protein
MNTPRNNPKPGTGPASGKPTADDLVRHQQGKLLEASLFVKEALERIEARQRARGVSLELSEQLISWTRTGGASEALPVLHLFARTFGEKAGIARLDPDLLSLCVLVSGALVEELKKKEMTEELTSMAARFPALNLAWCFDMLERERLQNLPVAGIA